MLQSCKVYRTIEPCESAESVLAKLDLFCFGRAGAFRKKYSSRPGGTAPWQFDLAAEKPKLWTVYCADQKVCGFGSQNLPPTPNSRAVLGCGTAAPRQLMSWLRCGRQNFQGSVVRFSAQEQITVDSDRFEKIRDQFGIVWYVTCFQVLDLFVV